MQQKTKPVNNFLLMFLLVAAATALRFAFNDLLGHRAPMLFHVLAVVICAEIAGTVVGLVTTGLSTFLIYSLFMPPPFSLRLQDPQEIVALSLFALTGVFISVIVGRQHRYKRALETSHERTALAHGVARMGTFEWFVSEGHSEWSPELETLYGIETMNHLHTIEEWKARLHPEDLPGVLAGLRTAEQEHRSTFDQTYRIVRPDGDVRWVHSRRKYDYDSHGKPVHAIGINIDVTDLERGAMAQEILGGFVEVCSACRRIHDSHSGEWLPMENYLHRHSDTRVSHGMCHDCGKRWLAEATDYDHSDR